MTSSKPPLIFLHGLRSGPLAFQPIVDQFPDYEVFVPDIPPFGKKASTLPTYNLESYINFLHDFIKTNSITRPVLVGYSMGSIIASAFAAAYPHLINQKLVLIAPISKTPSRFFANIAPLASILPDNVMNFLSISYLFANDDPKIFAETLKVAGACGRQHAKKSDVGKASLLFARHSVAEFQFKNQTLIISGLKDRVTPKRHTIALAKRLRAEFHLLPDSGHLINHEQPDAIAALMRSFLTQ